MSDDNQSDVDNVVVVVVDALRADKVGVYGCDRGLTPAIDSLANDSVVFENAFASSNTTDPSVTTLHTGRFPLSTVFRHGEFVTDAEKNRVEAVPWLPSILSEEGMYTVATGRWMGRWHKRGFDHYPSPENTALWARISNGLGSVSPGLQRVASNLFDLLVTESGRTTSAVDTFLDELDGEPFYGFVHLDETHTPYDPPEDRVDELLEAYEYSSDPLEPILERLGGAEFRERLDPWLTQADYDAGVGRIHARYDAAVERADRKVQQLIDGLREAGVWKNTHLVVTSDHGESLGEHDIYFDHHGLYDETIWVPLLVRLPSGLEDRVTETVSLLDVMPTVLDLLGIEASSPLDGWSLRPLLYGEGSTDREAIFAVEAFTQRRYAVRTDEWKLIEHETDSELERRTGSSLACRYCGFIHGAETELYDVSNDSGETTNCSASYPDIVEHLRTMYDRYTDRLVPPDIDDQPATYDDEQAVLERLEDLGYK